MVLYRGNERILFNILKQIYYLQKEEVAYGYHMFQQLTNKIEKEKLDRYLFLELHQDIPYSKRNNIHYYNNLYKDEISRLAIKKSYIRLETEQLSSSFFTLLNEYSPNYFVCEFKYQDYFFLQEFSQKETI